MKHADTVRDIYRDFAAGNASAILETFADDIEFRLTENHPYRGAAGAWHGKEAVVQNFFAVAGPEWDGWTMSAEQVIEASAAVVVEGRYNGLYKPTRQRMDVQVCHVWRFRGGKVASFHQYVDTAALRRVMMQSSGAV